MLKSMMMIFNFLYKNLIGLTMYKITHNFTFVIMSNFLKVYLINTKTVIAFINQNKFL
jgi:hypothetical protein